MDDNASGRRGRVLRVLDVLASLAMIAASIVIAGAIVFRPAATGRQRPAGSLGIPLPSTLFSLDRGPRQGAASSKVAIVEYSDFECPFCGAFARGTYLTVIRPGVQAGRIQFTFRHLPLEQRHRFALRAAEAAECSNRQGRFWEMHDALFRVDHRLDEGSLFAKAQEVGVRSDAFGACMHGEATARIREDAAEARLWGITGTPSFLFGIVQPDGRRLKVLRRESGALSPQSFGSIVDQLLKVAQIARRDAT